MQQILRNLQQAYPSLKFSKGTLFCWSPQTQTVTYKRGNGSPTDIWSLLHEVSHAVLNHTTYSSDFELLQLEIAAWVKAQGLAKKYAITIDENHIQDCLDTYRDWLHSRSTCPLCGNKSLQKDPEHYNCFNCHTEWKVTASRFCRPYRLLAKTNKKSPIREGQAIFQ